MAYRINSTTTHESKSCPGASFVLFPKTLAKRQQLERALVDYETEVRKLEIERERVQAKEYRAQVKDLEPGKKIVSIKSNPGPDDLAKQIMTEEVQVSDEVVQKVMEIQDKISELKDKKYRPAYLKTFLSHVIDMEYESPEHSGVGDGVVMNVVTPQDVLEHAPSAFLDEILDTIGVQCGLTQEERENLLSPSYFVSQLERAQTEAQERLRNMIAKAASESVSTASETANDTSQN